jgi:hypothetical protein
MARGSALSGLEKLLTNIVSEIKELKKQISKVGRQAGKPGPKPKRGRPGRPKLKKAGRPKILKAAAGKKPGRKPSKKGCSVRGCKNKHYAKGLCVNHYQSARLKAKKAGVNKEKATPAGIQKRGRPRVEPKTCSVKGCKRKVVARGLCVNHYQQARRKASQKKQ